ncbi:MAG: hypothetical protein AB7Q97_03465 [Gammaproteobacteria bacterium]
MMQSGGPGWQHEPIAGAFTARIGRTARYALALMVLVAGQAAHAGGKSTGIGRTEPTPPAARYDRAPHGDNGRAPWSGGGRALYPWPADAYPGRPNARYVNPYERRYTWPQDTRTPGAPVQRRWIAPGSRD